MFCKNSKAPTLAHPIPHPRSQFKQLEKNLYKTLSETKYLPAEGGIHVVELGELQKEKRECPARVQDKDKEIKKLIGLKDESAGTRRLSHIIGEYRSAFLQKTKLDLHQAIMKRYPVVQPKPFQHHSMLFVTYASSDLDKQNYTLWKEGGVNVSDAILKAYKTEGAQLNYLDYCWAAKRAAFDKLVLMGMDTEVDSIYNLYFKITRESVNFNKFCYLGRLYSKSRKNYDTHAAKSLATINKMVAKLARLTHIQRFKLQTATVSKEDHVQDFYSIASFALVFDPLCQEYDQEFFQNCGLGEAIYPRYLEFLTLAETIQKGIVKLQNCSNVSIMSTDETVDRTDLVLATPAQSNLRKRKPAAIEAEAPVLDKNKKLKRVDIEAQAEALKAMTLTVRMGKLKDDYIA